MSASIHPKETKCFSSHKLNASLIALLLIGMVAMGNSQGIGIGTTNPHSSALLELSSTTKGLLLPRMTGTQINNISNPSQGLLLFNQDSDRINFYNGTSWEDIDMDLWTSPFASDIIYYNGKVGVGTSSFFNTQMRVETAIEQTGLIVTNNAPITFNKYGISAVASVEGTGLKWGIDATANANASATNPVYGIQGTANQGQSAADCYGIYGFVTGSGTGERWAGYFNGDTKVTQNLFIEQDLDITNKLFVGDFNFGFAQMGVKSTQPFGLALENTYSGSSQKTGIDVYIGAPGTGSKRAIQAFAQANTGSSADVYGVYGSVGQFTSPANCYAIYGAVSGSGSGSRWAGYFSGEAKVTDELNIGVSDKIRLQPSGYNSGGEIEIYDNDGTKTLMLRGNRTSAQGSEIVMLNETGEFRIEIEAEEGNGRGANIDMFNQDEVQTIEIDADYANTGESRIVVDELILTGGSDLAEYFPASTSLNMMQPGQVVVIDPENPGKVMLSTKAHDKKVIGIVSGANGVKPGIFMGQEESIAFGDIPVTITGRVYVRADQSAGDIEPGDFLTTSDKAGMAMRVNDWGKARGAILGKAMTYPDQDGFVLVLVDMQ